jgi:hypothetical protein
VNPRAGMDDVEKRKFLTLLEFELRHLGRPARSQSLYRLRYPGSPTLYVIGKIYAYVHIGPVFTPTVPTLATIRLAMFKQIGALRNITIH